MPKKKPPPPPPHGPGPHGPGHHGPPPHHPPPPRPHHGRGRGLGFVDAGALDAALMGLLPDEHDRKLVLRCVLEEGPAHHRGANFVLLRLLAGLGAQPAPAAEADAVAVPMRLPPHIAAHDDATYPLRLPLAPLREIATDAADVDAMVACLTDGPPQHALANVLMVCLLDGLRRGGT